MFGRGTGRTIAPAPAAWYDSVPQPRSFAERRGCPRRHRRRFEFVHIDLSQARKEATDEEIIATTREVVEYARTTGALVESEPHYFGGSSNVYASTIDYDDREWHVCLHALVTDPSLRERVGTAARQHVLEAYSVERIVTDYLRLFDRLLGHLPAQRLTHARP